MAVSPAPEFSKELAQKALQANKDHQYALKVYTERLEAELEAVDKLLVGASSGHLQRKLTHDFRLPLTFRRMISTSMLEAPS